MARNRQTAENLSQREVEALWKKYHAHPTNAIRERLVEHYFPWFLDQATRMVGRMSLEDRENAVGEACLALSERIVPKYDGRGPFENWASSCIKNLFTSIYRKEGRINTLNIECIDTVDGVSVAPPPMNVRFSLLTARLSDKHAAVVWLRFYCGLTIEESANILKIPSCTVKSRGVWAIANLKKMMQNGDFAA